MAMSSNEHEYAEYAEYADCGKATMVNCYDNSPNCILKCEVLPDCNEKPELFCKQCNKNLCKVCHRYHDSLQKDHDIEHLSVKFTTGLNYEKAKQFAVVCPHYLQKHLNLYCMACETLLCKACAEEEHGGHRIVNFDNAVADTQVMYEKMIDDCKIISTKTTNSIEEMNQFLILHDEMYEETVDQFSEFVEKLKNQLDKKKTKQIAELKSKADNVRSSIQMQIEFWERKLELENHLPFLIHLFDKKESRTDWLAMRKSFRSMWGFIENHHPPPFKYSGVASFIPNKSFMRFIEEMAIGTLHIVPSEMKNVENSDMRLDTDVTVTSGYADTELIDIQSASQLVEGVEKKDTFARFFEYKDSSSGFIRKTVLKFEGANNCSDVVFDHHTNILHVSVKDKKEKTDNKTEEQISKDANSSSKSCEIYNDIDCDEESSSSLMTIDPRPLLEPPNLTKLLGINLTNDLGNHISMHSKRELVSRSHGNLYQDDSRLSLCDNQGTTIQKRSIKPPPIPPRRRKKSNEYKSNSSLSVIDSAEISEIKHEKPPVVSKKPPFTYIPEGIKFWRRSSCI